ncbi:hypothetical protein niasHS_013746 [Heterodera schachtii]|uniref:LIM zinc-binding domain-containing protein n=2 Tax=Heterodera TaxID=34509 RepID=A0ABD2IR21_HETSC
MFPAGPKKKFCSICRATIEVFDDKVMTERHIVHKKCFNCGICNTPLLIGRCAMDDVLYHQFGPLWFCPAHMMLGSGEKYELLKKAGKVKEAKEHIPQEFIASNK